MMIGEQWLKEMLARRRLFRVVWVVPLVALAVAAKIVVDRLSEFGPEITVAFSDGAGLRAGQLGWGQLLHLQAERLVGHHLAVQLRAHAHAVDLDDPSWYDETRGRCPMDHERRVYD